MCFISGRTVVNQLLFEFYICVRLTLRISFNVGSFDMKTSRVQECGSMDMSKYSHAQAGKIKSKYFVS